ncbi:hypothetical protein ACHQM5_014494 [Ranunculus cassubicifolius]
MCLGASQFNTNTSRRSRIRVKCLKRLRRRSCTVMGTEMEMKNLKLYMENKNLKFVISNFHIPNRFNMWKKLDMILFKFSLNQAI